MAQRSANITSIDAIRALKLALMQFGSDVQTALDSLEAEARRPVEWIEHDRSQYWPREVRRRSDELSEARLALQRCELTIDGTETKYCYDERKALERAKRRLNTAEEKVQAVRRWRNLIRKEFEEFQVQLEKLRHYVTSDLAQAVVAAERMAEAVDRYLQQQAPSQAVAAASFGAKGKDASA